MTALQKLCKLCNTTKEAKFFTKNSSLRDGLHSYCKDCSKIRSAEWYKANRDTQLEKNKLKYKENTEAYRARRKAQYAKEKEVAKQKTAEWKRLHKDRVNATKAKRRAFKLKATPSWLSEIQLQQIADIYWLAADVSRITGESYHVDHIVPLQGKCVCGLHVPWNLQVLPSSENASKGNSYEC